MQTNSERRRISETAGDSNPPTVSNPARETDGSRGQGSAQHSRFSNHPCLGCTHSERNALELLAGSYMNRPYPESLAGQPGPPDWTFSRSQRHVRRGSPTTAGTVEHPRGVLSPRAAKKWLSRQAGSPHSSDSPRVRRSVVSVQVD